MKRSPRPRKISELSQAVNHQLTLYSLAASAAGVSGSFHTPRQRAQA
jgi:hypothetical protein